MPSRLHDCHCPARLKPRSGFHGLWGQALALIAALGAAVPGTPGWAAEPQASAAVARPPERDDVTATWENANNAFKYQDFDTAIPLLRSLLYPVVRLDLRRELRVREYLGAALWWTGKRDESFDEFNALLVKHPGARLDPAQYPPKMVEDFEARRRRLVNTGVIKADGPSQPLDLEPRTAAAPAYPLMFFPLGVGQFANREPLKGWLLLAGQAALAGVSAGYYIANRDAGHAGPRPLADDALQIGTGIGFWLLAGYGVWDALNSYDRQWPTAKDPK
jgi:hypothetical protein